MHTRKSSGEAKSGDVMGDIGAPAASRTGKIETFVIQYLPFLERFFRRAPDGSLSLLQQGLRFSIVGGINTIVDLSVLNLLLLLDPRGRSGWLYSIFKGMSFLAAVTNSYFLNRKFTFQTKTAASSAQFSGFLVIAIGGFLINVGVATAVATYVPAPAILAAYWPSIAALVGIPFGLVWNFFGYRYLVF